MSDHSTHAEKLAERAGGYLRGFETATGPTPGDYAAAAQATATLSLAQRIAVISAQLASLHAVLDLDLKEIRAELNRKDSPAEIALRDAITDAASRLGDQITNALP